MTEERISILENIRETSKTEMKRKESENDGAEYPRTVA